MFKNKHVVLALIIAPILAIISYFGVDLALSEKPISAQTGHEYQLSPRSNCRYTSGVCSLVNGDFQLQLRSEPTDNQTIALKLTSPYALQGAKIDLKKDPNAQPAPMQMTPIDPEHKVWEIQFNDMHEELKLMQLVVMSGDVLYHAQTSTDFMEYKTFFTE